MPVRQIDSTVKVYTRQVSTQPWVESKLLTCLSVTDGYGLIQPHTAQLKAITPDMSNDATDADVVKGKAAIRYNADVEFQISKVSVFYQGIVGLWARVTTSQSGSEVTIFIGQISGNNLGLQNLFVDGITAYGIDWCLNHQGAVGSNCYDINDTAVHFDAVIPHFNPNNRPNMGAENGGINVFDYSLYKDITVDENYWKPSKVVKYILGRLISQTSNIYPTEKRYSYYSVLTNSQYTLDNDSDVYIYEQKVQDMELVGVSIWAALVQLVESNGPFTLTIKYSGEFARLTVVEL